MMNRIGLRCYICGEPTIEPARLCTNCQEKRLARAVEKAMVPKVAGWSTLDRWLVYAFATTLVGWAFVAGWRKSGALPANSVVKAVPAKKLVVEKKPAPQLTFEVPAPSLDEPAVTPPRPPDKYDRACR